MFQFGRRVQQPVTEMSSREARLLEGSGIAGLLEGKQECDSQGRVQEGLKPQVWTCGPRSSGARAS